MNEDIKDVIYGIKKLLEKEGISQETREIVVSKLQDVENKQIDTNVILREIEQLLPDLKTEPLEQIKAEIINLKDIPAPVVNVPEKVEVKGLRGHFKQLNSDLIEMLLALVERVFKVRISGQDGVIEVQLTHNGRRYKADSTSIFGGGGGAGFPFAKSNGQPKEALVTQDGRVEAEVRLADTGNADAFGRLRVSNPRTIFDSKQIHNNQPLFWDDQEVSGGGTSSTYSQNSARTRIGVSANTAGKRVRQTFQRFNYQPAKSQLIFMTAVMSSAGASGIKASIGIFDDNNGLFFTVDNGVLKAVIRSNVTGSPVDTEVAQANWNLDTMDGTGPSRVTLDPTKTQIAIIDYEWLGVGRVRMGFVVDGKIYYCHEFKNTNNLAVVYMSTPNLPLRYEIENDGTGPATTMDHICSSIVSEGGQEKNGILRHVDSGSIGSLSAGTTYALIGIRLKSANLDGVVDLENISVLATTTNDKAHWELHFNPTVASTFTYADQTNSIVQTATGAVANTVSNGTEIDGGYFSTALPANPTVPNALRIGSKIDGTRDSIVLTCTPITNNITVEASMTWRELS